MERILIVGPDSAPKGSVASALADYKGISPISISTITPDPQAAGDQIFVVYLETEPTPEEVDAMVVTLEATAVLNVTGIFS